MFPRKGTGCSPVSKENVKICTGSEPMNILLQEIYLLRIM
jgi:hypothetical protein